MLVIYHRHFFWIFRQIQGFLGHFRSFQAILGNFRQFQAILGHFQAKFSAKFSANFFCQKSHHCHTTRFLHVWQKINLNSTYGSKGLPLTLFEPAFFGSQTGITCMHVYIYAYIQKTSSVAEMDIWAKKKWRKIWSKNGLKWPKIA